MKRLFKAPRFQAEGRELYRQIAERARRPVLYTLYGVPDTIDGRFEMLCLHAYALFHGLKGKGPDADLLSQAIYDAMFADLDGSLRELGVADLGVGRRIKTMTEALNGRIQAYDRALSMDGAELERTVRRNVYGTTQPRDDQVGAMACHLSAIRAHVAQAPFREICDASVMRKLPEPPAMLESTNARR
ncbi:MAG: ubiquinol-cytochrome C chaperone family protein [Dongiaceae bacterium]